MNDEYWVVDSYKRKVFKIMKDHKDIITKKSVDSEETFKEAYWVFRSADQKEDQGYLWVVPEGDYRLENAGRFMDCEGIEFYSDEYDAYRSIVESLENSAGEFRSIVEEKFNISL
jgi:hypothetical protein